MLYVTIASSVLCLFLGGFLGYRWGRVVEAELQWAEAEAAKLGKFISDKAR